MSFAVPKVDKDTSSIAKLGGSALSIFIWIGLVFIIFNHFDNNNTVETKEVKGTKGTDEIVVEPFIPQTEDGEVREDLLAILRSVQKQNERCEREFKDKGKIKEDCFNHNKTFFWRMVKEYLEQLQKQRKHPAITSD